MRNDGSRSPVLIPPPPARMDSPANNGLDIEGQDRPLLASEAESTPHKSVNGMFEDTLTKSSTVAKHHASAQIAPLPLTVDFHAGKVVTSAEPPLARNESEESYIPVTLARAHLSKVVADMHTLKAEQTQRVQEIVARYEAIEQDMKAQFEQHVRGVKAKAKARLTTEKQRYDDLVADKAAMAAHHADEIHSWEGRLDARELEFHHQRENWTEALERELQLHEDQLAQFQVLIARELASLSTSMSNSHSEAERLLRDQLLMCREDAEAQAHGVGDSLERLMADMQAKEKAFHYQMQQLQLSFDRDTAIAYSLNVVIDAAVDQVHQTRAKSHVDELNAHVSSLESQVQHALTREQSLQAKLEQARTRFDELERAAISQTLQLVVETVEVAHAVDAARQQDAAAKIMSTSIQTDDGSMSTPRKPTTEAGTQMVVDNSNIGDAADTPAATTTEELTAMQIEYQSQVEIYRERNQEILHSKHELRRAKAELQTLLDAKAAAKSAIKTWLAGFQAEHSRDPTLDEKAQVKDLYLTFKDAEAAYNDQKNSVADMKKVHHEKVVAVEAFSQWQTIGSMSRASARSSEDDDKESLSSSTASSRPGTSSLSFTPLPDQTLELTQELARLRRELDQIRSAERTRTAEVKDQSAKTDGVIENEVDEALADGDDLPVTHSRTGRIVAIQQEEQQEQARLDELRSTITDLGHQVEVRNAEKKRLEQQIEQLRLHLELTGGGADDGDVHPTSEAKVANLFFDEAVDIDDEVAADDEDGQADEDEDDTVYIASSSSAAALGMLADSKDEEQAVAAEDEEPLDIKEDAMRRLQLVALIKTAVERGKVLFNRGDKVKCYQTYAKCCEECVEELRSMNQSNASDVKAIKKALAEAARMPAPRGSTVLRKQLDDLRDANDKWLQERERRAEHRREEQKAAHAAAAAASAASVSPSKGKGSKRTHKSTKKETEVEDKDESAVAPAKQPAAAAMSPANGRALEEAKQKLKALETKAKADKVKITQLEMALSKAESQASSGGNSNNGGGGNSAALERRLADTEKKHKAAMEEAEKQAKKEVASLSAQLQTAQGKTSTLQEQLAQAQKELGAMGNKATQVTKLEQEMTVLREQAAQVGSLSKELGDAKQQFAKLETSYKEEQALRKKYYNQIEDMKGKIRVYARCRPMSGSELERGCQTCVRFVDEYSLELETSRGPKPFAYDQVFSPASTQDQVFEDTKNLLQSAMDGYNVCIFAYGQTGSGKTFTMTGTESIPGLTPRAIHHLFTLAEEARGNFTVSFQAVMLELYNDNLIDLFHLVDDGRDGKDAPKLDIKKSEKGMVYVQNATSKACTSAAQTLKLFEAANKKRQVGATKMNAESSRSHSIFSILIESYNKTTKATTTGKLSLVDLAGSERAGKTGATAERLKEAQAINKSLSALGDVISALSTNEKFIPYRNNKLTQLMQDSLGGNAKTLMFVNISPADYNQEETQTSLQYASRVKLITNNANKNAESEQVNKLKAIIRQLRAGKTDVDLDGVLD